MDREQHGRSGLNRPPPDFQTVRLPADRPAYGMLRAPGLCALSGLSRALGRKIGTSPDAGERILGRSSGVHGRVSRPAPRRITMQLNITPMLAEIRMAEMRREAEAA